MGRGVSSSAFPPLFSAAVPLPPRRRPYAFSIACPLPPPVSAQLFSRRAVLPLDQLPVARVSFPPSSLPSVPPVFLLRDFSELFLRSNLILKEFGRIAPSFPLFFPPLLLFFSSRDPPPLFSSSLTLPSFSAITFVPRFTTQTDSHPLLSADHSPPFWSPAKGLSARACFRLLAYRYSPSSLVEFPRRP